MESLLVRTLESEKRLRSEGGQKKNELRKHSGGSEGFHVSGERTQHEDLREPLDAEALGAFPSAFTSAAHLKDKRDRR